MEKYATIFKEVLDRPEFRYSGSEMARWSGFTNAHMSRFLTGKCDISAGKFFQLLESMPPKFQDCYWAEYRNSVIEKSQWDWYALVDKASDKEIGEILAALAKRYTEDSKKSLVAA